MPIEVHRAVFDNNVVPSLVLIRQIVGRMLERKNGRRSALIYVGSNPGYAYPVPGQSMYVASKAYQDFVGAAVGFELSDRIDGLSFTCG